MVVTVPEVPSRCSACGRRRARRRSDRHRPRPPRSSPRTISRRHRHAAVALGQRDDADRHRDPGIDRRMRRAVLRRRAAAEPHQFRGAAADVEQDRRPRHPDRPAACSRWRRAAPRFRGRRSRARCRPRCAMRSRNSGPLPAARQASVAISRARVTPRLRILSRQTRSASTARTIAASLSRPELVMPSPSRMMRENASTTRKLSRVGARHQQPAVVGAEIERRIGRAGHIRPPCPPPSWRSGGPGADADRRPPAPPGPSAAPGQAAGSRPVARASSSIVKPFPTPKPLARGSARRRGGQFVLRGKV